MSDWEEDLNKQRLEFLKGLTPKKMLGELLAHLHGDGGHHTEKVGLAKSVFDAEQRSETRPHETHCYMADKYRPKRIEIKATMNHADEIEDMLKEGLHRRAKMERKDEGEVVSFAFWPTKSECFLVAVTLRGLEYKWKKKGTPI